MKRYRARMQQLSARGHADDSPKTAPSLFSHASLVFGKTSFELILFGLLVGIIAIVALQHSYFKITDIQIDGLDSYAHDRALKTVDQVLNKKIFGLTKNNFVLFEPSELQVQLQKTLALESLEITKRFPHTLIVHAAERQIVSRVELQNGTALISSDGKLVRWYEPQSEPSNGVGTLYSTIKLNNTSLDHALLAQIIQPETMSGVAEINRSVVRIHGQHIKAILLDDETKTASIEFDAEFVIVVRLDANVETQMEKAALTMNKYPTAKRIDVRFGDKAFINF